MKHAMMLKSPKDSKEVGVERKVQLLYFSPTGTTAAIAGALGRGLGRVDTLYDKTLPKERETWPVFEKGDLVVVGGPVYAGRLPLLWSRYLEKLEGRGAKALAVVVYGNRDYDDALLELVRTLKESGFDVTAAAAFIGEHSRTTLVASGRPDGGDLKAAENWGRQVAGRLEGSLGEAEVKGQLPYKEIRPGRPVAPATSSLCIQCGICAEYCPVEAIDPVDYARIDADRCLACCSCIKRCPVGAKAMDDQASLDFVTWLIDHCGKLRREPEYFG